MKLSPTMVEGEIVEWKVQEGQPYKNGDVLFSAQTDKSVVEFNAIDDGIIRKILKGPHSVCRVGDPIAIATDEVSEDITALIDEFEKGQQSVQTPSAPIESKEKVTVQESMPTATMMAEPEFHFAPPLENLAQVQGGTDSFATPFAKHLADEQGRDLRGVKGSGYQGMVTAKDVEKAPSLQYAKIRSKTPLEAKPGSYTTIPLTPMRKAIAKRLQQSKQFIPHFYVTHVVETAKLMETRQQLKDFGIECTVNDFILRATALALREHPEVNSGFDAKNQAIVRFLTVDISVAVSIPEGLITPIVRVADYKSLEELSKEVKFLAKKAKEGTLKPEEYQGGSFTLSNLGMYGIESFMPIINPPQAAILGVGGAIKGEMRLTLAADHRVVDGADAAKFLSTMKKLLENPALLIL
ncbi:MAG: 2-oxo acid dehydrogenase subunit E2 [Verrucomicrobia bacterium]|nr:2-oxo acid dehydrogenase subunit E2 [Verrucomicrobiota bacterium]